jgi:FkbM family methyltransferase
MTRDLLDLLSPGRLTEVVDVGANPIDGPPPYAPMLAAGLCRVTGFEPQSSALLELQRSGSANERYLPHAVGDGGPRVLNVCRGSGMTSLYEPDAAMLDPFEVLKPLAQVVDRIAVQTRRVDTISEIRDLDFLKVDVQGSEPAVLRGETRRLSQAAVVQSEVSFVPLYRDQPVFGDIDLELRSQGFLPHCFAAVKCCPIAPALIDDDPRKPLNQLLEADMVYVRDFSRPDLMSEEQLKHLALIAHFCYRSFDLALRCVMLLERRQALKDGAQHRYAQIVSESSRPHSYS